MGTTAELRDEVLAHQFSTPRYGTLIERWLDEAQKFIIRQTDIRTQRASQTIATTANDSTYTLPTDYARLVSLRNTDDRDLLSPITLNHFDDLDTSTGKPYAFVVVGSETTLYPTPDGVYNLELRYYKLPATLTSSGSAVDPVIPAEYHHVLVNYALAKTYAAEHDLDASLFHRQEFENSFGRLKSELHSDTYSPPEVVDGTWGGDSAIYDSWWT